MGVMREVEWDRVVDEAAEHARHLVREGKYPREACSSAYWYALHRLHPAKDAPDITRVIEQAAKMEFEARLKQSELARIYRQAVPQDRWDSAMEALERGIVAAIQEGESWTTAACSGYLAALGRLRPGGAEPRKVVLRAFRRARKAGGGGDRAGSRAGSGDDISGSGRNATAG